MLKLIITTQQTSPNASIKSNISNRCRIVDINTGEEISKIFRDMKLLMPMADGPIIVNADILISDIEYEHIPHDWSTTPTDGSLAIHSKKDKENK